MLNKLNYKIIIMQKIMMLKLQILHFMINMLDQVKIELTYMLN